MRRLHATGPRERHVAGGLYLLPDGAQEHWSIHEVGDGAHFIRVDRDGRAADGRSLLQEALRSPCGQIERIDQQLYGRDGRPAARLRCTRFGDRAEIALEGMTGQRSLRLDLAPDYVLLAPGVLLSGLALARASRMKQPVSLLRLSCDGDDFAWKRCTASARCGGRSSLETGGRALEARPCVWSGSEVRHWLDGLDVTLRRETGARRVELTRYSRRHD